MKHLSILFLLFASLAFSQAPKMKVSRYVHLTTAQRDALNVRNGEAWVIYNTDVNTLQFWDGTEWKNTAGDGTDNQQLSLNNDVLSIERSTNDVNLKPYKEIISLSKDNAPNTLEDDKIYIFGDSIVNPVKYNNFFLKYGRLTEDDKLILDVHGSADVVVDLSKYKLAEDGGIKVELDPTVPSILKSVTQSDINAWLSKLTKSEIEAMGFVDGPKTVDTNTQLSKSDIEAMGFVDGAHTTDTKLSKAEIEAMGFVDGAHTVNTDNQNASQVPVSPVGNITSLNVQLALEELQQEIDGFAASSGQTNTAANVGVGGVGLYHRKTGANLEFKKINAGSNKVTVTNDPTNEEVDIDINDSNITISKNQISDLNTIDTKLSKAEIQAMGFVDGPHTVDTNTQRSREEVQDFVGSMLSGNTENGISVTYDDTNNEIDFVVNVADGSSTNELQNLTYDSGGIGNPSISISNGNSIELPVLKRNENTTTSANITANRFVTSALTGAYLIDGNGQGVLRTDFLSSTSSDTMNGNLTVTGTVTANSDRRLKSNIHTIGNSLDKVGLLRGVYYTKDGRKEIGLIAQEVEKVIPEVVFTANDQMQTKSIAYQNLVALLIESVKELEKQNLWLQTQILELKK